MPAFAELLIQAALPDIIKYGPGAVQAFLAIFTSKTVPTQAQWDALDRETQVTARDQMLQVLKDHNVDPASPQGIALLALTPT